MSLRYHFFQNPKTVVYETPAQAYMIIEGVCSGYKGTKLQKKRSRRSLCCQRCRCSKSKNSKRQQKLQNKQSLKRNRRLQSYDGVKKNENQKIERQNYGSVKKNNLEAISFRDLNILQAKNQISCNYKKMMEQQNVCLRRQNRFLQQYIQTLESKSKGSLNMRKEENIRNSKKYEASRSSMTRRNVQNGKSSDTDEGSTFTNKIYKTNGQSEWASTYHN